MVTSERFLELSSRPLNVAVVGATGPVGSGILRILTERKFPVGDIRVSASEQSAGRIIQWQDHELTVEDANTATYDGVDLAFLAVDAEIAKELAPIIVDAGALVIDNSSAWRQDPDVPLVVSEVNPEALQNIPKGIVANPNCTTMELMPVLKPMHDAAILKKLIVSTYQSVSGAGREGIDEYNEQLRAVADYGDDAVISPKVFPRRIISNVIAQRGNMIEDGQGHTDEELKLVDESRKILDIANLAVSATCVSVPVVTGHSITVEAIFRKPISPETARRILWNAPGVRLDDLPTPEYAVGGDHSLVGRIRQSGAEGDCGLSLFVCGDNTRKGSGLNAVQLAELVAYLRLGAN